MNFTAANSLLGTSVPVADLSIYDGPCRRKGGALPKSARGTAAFMAGFMCRSICR